MKEIKQFEQWADRLLAEASEAKHTEFVIPGEKDIKHKAMVKYPYLSPEQAMMMWFNDELEKSEKVDASQSKSINRIDKTVKAVDRELDDVESEVDQVEREENQIERELAAIRRLINQ